MSKAIDTSANLETPMLSSCLTSFLNNVVGKSSLLAISQAYTLARRGGYTSAFGNMALLLGGNMASQHGGNMAPRHDGNMALRLGGNMAPGPAWRTGAVPVGIETLAPSPEQLTNTFQSNNTIVKLFSHFAIPQKHWSFLFLLDNSPERCWNIFFISSRPKSQIRIFFHHVCGIDIFK